MAHGLSAAGDTDTNLQRGKAGAHFAACFECTEAGDADPDFLDGNGADAAVWLPDKDESGAEEGCHLRELAADDLVDEAEDGVSGLGAGGCGGSDVFVRPAAQAGCRGVGKVAEDTF
eukprot:jgi/Ulvmu1/11602/UM008_0003.1